MEFIFEMVEIVVSETEDWVVWFDENIFDSKGGIVFKSDKQVFVCGLSILRVSCRARH